MKKLSRYFVAAVAALGMMLTSCQNEAPYVFNPSDQNGFGFVDWNDVFESYWNAMNHNYAFWDIETTDWDKVYADYKPQFEGLEFGVREDSIKAAELFSEITSPLKDHHYGFWLKNNNGGYCLEIRPGLIEAGTRDYYHDKMSASQMFAVMQAMEDSGRITNFVGNCSEDPDAQGFVFYTCLIDNSIVYLRLNGFDLGANLSDEKVTAALANYYQLIDKTPRLKGIIIDTRSNGGGSIDDEHLFLTPLLNAPHTFAYCRSKLGIGRLDYTPWSPCILEPTAEMKEDVTRDVSNLPIVSIIDLHSISMAELTAIAIQELPNGTVIGERSFGGHGPLNNDNNQFYAGTLENSAYKMYTSTSMTRRLDGKCYEGIGVIPDIEAMFDADEFYNGNDTQLDRAVRYIHTGK